ncbi:MAG: hypothetical protein OXE78_06355 [Gammaproteobacteria bacterium]|nr:hypothetical protein [Gammaproteobacteria bacterium]MCY4357480.1 hypothetical protein [Gammaproteobacteria bacterium]
MFICFCHSALSSLSPALAGQKSILIYPVASLTPSKDNKAYRRFAGTSFDMQPIFP